VWRGGWVPDRLPRRLGYLTASSRFEDAGTVAGSIVLHQPALRHRASIRLPDVGRGAPSLWRMALSTVQSTLWGFMVGITSGFVTGPAPRAERPGRRASSTLHRAFNSLPRIALVPSSPWCSVRASRQDRPRVSIVFSSVLFQPPSGAAQRGCRLIHSRAPRRGERQILAR